MKVAVTGGSGVVGRALVRHLVAAGHEVLALARSTQSSAMVESLGATPVYGHLNDPESLDGLVSEAEMVFNVAGVNELCPKDLSGMWRTNVDGALAVLEASERAGVRRLVQTSSAVTIGASGEVVADETTRHRGHFISEYERSKTVAERLLFQQSEGVEVVSVNPSSVQGPGRASGTGRLLLLAASGKARLAFDATVSIVDIDDCAQGHLAAAERGVAGQRYLLSGATTTVRHLLRSVATIAGHNTRPRFVSRDALTRVRSVFALVSYGSLCPELIDVSLESHRYDGSRAVAELGLAYRPLTETLQRTIAWLREKALLE